MANEYYVRGNSAAAEFTLKIHRGEGMCLLAMDWKQGEPPRDFVGFAIEYCEPGKDRFFAVTNRLCFPGRDGAAVSDGTAPRYPSTEAPIQKFRWVHFPRFAQLEGEFQYRVTPMFMAADGLLNKGIAQEAKLALWRETYPGKVNICFTRGFVSSQAFVDRYEKDGGISKLIAPTAHQGLQFLPTHPRADEALAWMGFEARERILDLLDKALADNAEVRVIAYELNLPEMVERLEKFGGRLKIILDDSGSGTKSKALPSSPESEAGKRLEDKGSQILRQHMGRLQHNKMIVIDGPNLKVVVYGSTNFSWRGVYVQANNAVLISSAAAVAQALDSFEAYWTNAGQFRLQPAANWRMLPVAGVDAQINMSPHAQQNFAQNGIAQDIDSAKSSLLFSLAFLNQTPGVVTEAVARVTDDADRFTYGISDKQSGILLQKPDGKKKAVYSKELKKNVPEPFRSEPSGGSGNRMHHKFVVIDFDKPTARVYTGSFNFSKSADELNGENLLLFKDRKITTAYMIEALRLFDHYHFRVAMHEANDADKKLNLKVPPTQSNHQPWWKPYYVDQIKIRDREIFA